MRILYVVPGVMSKTNLGTKEMERRRGILQANAGKDVCVEITDIEDGPTSIESAFEEYLSVPATVSRIVQAEKDGIHGVILGCFGDPGIDAVREMVKIPVVGPGETSLMTAALLGHRFTIVTILDSVVPSLEKLARIVGIDGKLASVRTANIPVLELNKDLAVTKRKMIHEARNAVDKDRADVIILGCMSMAFLGLSLEMQEILGVPVVNPAMVSLKFLETLVCANLSHSKKAYPFPPKLMGQR